MKNLSLFTILIVLTLFDSLLFCQQDNCFEHINQFSTGKDKLTFTVFDYETKEPLIGAAIYSFDLKKILASTDIYGVARTDKGLEGNLEVSYIAYYSICFTLEDTSIDSVLLRMEPEFLNFGDGVVMLDTNTISPNEKGKFEAEQDLIENKIRLFIKNKPTIEQFSYAETHNFEFIIWEGNNSYREAYNEVVIGFLNNKYDKNVEEELRAICWRNYQP